MLKVSQILQMIILADPHMIYKKVESDILWTKKLKHVETAEEGGGTGGQLRLWTLDTLMTPNARTWIMCWLWPKGSFWESIFLIVLFKQDPNDSVSPCLTFPHHLVAPGLWPHAFILWQSPHWDLRSERRTLFWPLVSLYALCQDQHLTNDEEWSIWAGKMA